MKQLVVVFTAVTLIAVGCGGGDDDGQDTSASASVPFDQAFIDAMVPHHRDAIEMAKAARARGLTQPDLEQIAADIVASQQREIDQMLEWRERWFGSRELGPVLPETLGVPEAELGMAHGGRDAITEAEDVDATFAEMMLPHHEGAVRMAEAALERGEHDEVKELAAAIIQAQEREIEIMEKHASGMHHE